MSAMAPSNYDAAASSPVILQSRPKQKAIGGDSRKKDSDEDINDATTAQDAADAEYYKDQEAQIDYDSRTSLASNSFTRKMLKLGVEELGVHPIPEKDRTDRHFYQVATLWISMSVGLVPWVHILLQSL